MTHRSIDAAALAAMLADGGELALVDLREELVYAQGHLLHARSLPLSRLELAFARLVPRRGTRIVLCDAGEGQAARAAAILAAAGYDGLHILRGDAHDWEAAGLPVYSGINVPSKAFGEMVEHARATPSVTAPELARWLEARRDLVVLDSRPFDEYTRMSIPTAINVPGAELVLHIRDLAPSPATLVVVNCAGRTRSIIGAQSLIDAGVPNPVMALRNGTMGWELAGLACERGQTRRAPPASAEARGWSKAAATAVALHHGVARIDRATLEAWQRDGERRTLYLFDVRDPAEYAAGHVAGARSAPGGQLVQATDHYVGTLNARIVLCDEAEVRALMTASWLKRMGWREVFVLAETGDETATPAEPLLRAVPQADAIDAAALAALVARDAATLVDLSLSRHYRARHIPGAWSAIRARLATALPRIAPRELLVLTSEDGVLAGFAAAEAAALTTVPVRVLAGGNDGWAAAGQPLIATDPRFAEAPVDVWLKPYERASGVAAAAQAYLSWETALLERIARDPSWRLDPPL